MNSGLKTAVILQAIVAGFDYNSCALHGDAVTELLATYLFM